MSDEDTERGWVEMTCPFCGERDFDAPGLKGHLVNEDCAEYREVEATRRLFRCEPESAR